MSDTPTPPEYPAAPGSSDDTATTGHVRLDVADGRQVGYMQSETTPPSPGDEPPMTAAETLSGIFFEPGRTFEHLRRRPRFLVAALIIVVLTSTFVFLMYSRVGYEQFVRQAIEKNPRTADMPADQKQQIVRMQTGPIFKTIAYVSPGVGVAIFFFVGGALYLLGAMAMGKGVSYWQALSVWVYSSLPPSALFMVANIVLLFLKSPEDISPENAQRGLARGSLSFLVDPAARPVLATLLGLFDVFAIYGLVLAATGVRKVARLSSGSAWAVVLVVWLVGATIRLALAIAFGQAMA